MACAALLALPSCHPAEEPPGKRAAAARRPNIVLVTIDTLRADHLSCYGYPRPTTPFIDSIARRGLLYSNAYSTCSWTAPSMASLFTGLYPREHGVLHGKVETRDIVNQEALSSSLAVLPEALKQAGYRTFGVFANGHVSKELGFSRGFDHFENMWFDKSPAPNEAAFKLRKQLEASRPFFFWIHYFDPHAPYFGRRPWIVQYAADLPACREWMGIPMKQLRFMVEEIAGDPGAQRALVDLYDSEISYCDRQVQELFERLPLESNSVIAITSDHGEEFFDHRGLGHGDTLFEEVVRVPLIVKRPGSEDGAVISRPVSNKDLGATLLAAAGIKTKDAMPGENLFGAAVAATARAAPVFLELDRGWNMKGIRRGRWKLICRGKSLAKAKCQLYDLRADPQEANPVDAARPERRQALYDELAAWIGQRPVFEAPEGRESLSNDQKEELRSLGYLR